PARRPAVRLAAGRRSERHRADDRGPHAGQRQMRRQDRHADGCDQPGWLLSQSPWQAAGVRTVHRRAARLARTATRERDGRGDRAPLTGRGPRATLSTMAVGERGPAVNRRELAAYLERIRDRWPVEIALLGGARVADERGAPPQR